VLEKLGGRTRARTWDPMIKSQVLLAVADCGSCVGRRCQYLARQNGFAILDHHYIAFAVSCEVGDDPLQLRW
jgi:hypothetical protein